ncbi:MAG: AMP-binding protein [Spirochaetales bacterium]|nr:AMP-binding protein [Spirochaetales bacterium]
MTRISTCPTVLELFERSCQRFTDRPFLCVFENKQKRSLTYAQARERITAFAFHLRQQGVQPGDSVALAGRNSPEWALAFLAILWAEAVVVPLDAQLGASDLARLASLGRCRLVVRSKELSELDGLLPGVPVFPLDARELEVLPGQAFPQSVQNPGETAVILFTSGTTGHPKGVVLTHSNLVSDCLLAQKLLSISENDIFYALLPLHHAYTLLAVFLEAVSVGASILFAEKMAVSSVLSDLRQGQVTMFLAVPLLFNKLLAGLLKAVRERGFLAWVWVRSLMLLSGWVKKTTRYNPGKVWFRPLLDKAGLSQVRVCISGGGPLAPTVFRRFNELGLDFVQGYGLTETSPILALNPVERYKEKSVGRLIPGVEARLLNVDSQGQGELAVRGPMVMKGYFNDAAATEEVLSAGGWLRTGDVGRLDAENYLYLTGRVKSLIVSEGGKNVYPEEIEYAFQLYPEVEQVLVRGWLKNPALHTEGIEALLYPNADAVKAWSAARPGVDTETLVRAELGELVAKVNRGLAAYQKIDRFTVLKEPLEMTTTRKIKRPKPT